MCGADLGDAEDPYRDPSCGVCLDRENEEDLAYFDTLEAEAREAQAADATDEE